MIVWTIGYIESIYSYNIISVTYTYHDKNIILRVPNSNKYKTKEIVGIQLEGYIINQICEYDVIGICPFDNLDLKKIRIFYSYQECLINIAKRDYISRDFLGELKHKGISEILYTRFLNYVINKDYYFGVIYNYVCQTSINKLIDKLSVSICELYDKERNYNGYHIESTDYKDSYLNSLLHISESGNFYDFVDEDYCIILKKKIIQNALNKYSKQEHYKILIHECQTMYDYYIEEVERIISEARKYMNY